MKIIYLSVVAIKQEYIMALSLVKLLSPLLCTENIPHYNFDLNDSLKKHCLLSTYLPYNKFKYIIMGGDKL